MWRWAHPGQRCTIRSGKKLGTANRHARIAVTRTEIAFQREKNSMRTRVLRSGRRPRSAGRLVLHRFPLGTDFGHHRTHLPHADAVRDLDLDLIVVHDLGDLADHPPGTDHGIASPHALYHLPMLRPSPSLRP